MCVNGSSSRIRWVDVAKGILILLLLLSHLPSATNRLHIDRSLFWFINNWSIIYVSFYMQAFLFLSGFCSSFSKPLYLFCEGLFRQLILPFFLFETIILIEYSFWTLHEFSIKWILDFWISSNGTHLWFLNALVFSKVFIYCFIRLCKSNTILLSSSFFLLVLAIAFNQYNYGTNFFCLRQSLGSVFFVSLGYVLRKQSHLRLIIEKTGYSFPYIILLMVLLGQDIPTFTAGINVSVRQIPVFLFISISGMMTFFKICQKIDTASIFEYFGKNSLIVYCLHFFPLLCLVNITYNYLSPVSLVDRMFMVSVVYFFEFIVCILFIELFKTKPLNSIFGKK